MFKKYSFFYILFGFFVLMPTLGKGVINEYELGIYTHKQN